MKKYRDFNLEKKIEALPSLSLEEFQAMKKQQRTKKKKIVHKLGSSSKKHNDSSFQISSGITTRKTELLPIGSQKRKARIQNITRNVLNDTDSSLMNNEEEDNKGEFYSLQYDT